MPLSPSSSLVLTMEDSVTVLALYSIYLWTYPSCS
jgi:hypothetical protein